MRKTLPAILLSLLFSSGFAQDSSRVHRTAGFFVLPAKNNVWYRKISDQPEPQFGGGIGYNFANTWKNGLFFESGMSLITQGANHLKTEFSGSFGFHEEIDLSYTHYYFSWPFIIGYHMPEGKVRFTIGAGISLNCKLAESYHSKITYGDQVSEIRGFRKKPGADMSAILKAGLSFPLGKRIDLSIMPVLRYTFLYFDRPKYIICATGLTEFIYQDQMSHNIYMRTDEQPLSVGLELGVRWDIDAPAEVNPKGKTIKQKNKEYNCNYKNFIYIDFFGQAYYWSYNYERKLFTYKFLNLLVRAGLGHSPSEVYIPAGINMTLGKKSTRFETGVAFAFFASRNKELNLTLVPDLAFRIEAATHLFLRLSVMSHIGLGNSEWLPGAGISLGYCL